MSLGVLTVIAQTAAVGPVFHDNVSIVGDTSYPTTGSTGLQAKLNAVTKDGRAIVSARCYGGAGYVAEYDPATDKLKVSQSAGSAAPLVEVTATTDLSGVTFKLEILSK